MDLIKDIEEMRRHKADMLEPALINSTKELKIDVMQRRHQVENLEKDLEEKMSAYDSLQEELERLETEKEKLAISLSKASEMPIKIAKQTEILRDAINALNAENIKQATLAQTLDKELERLAKKKKDLEELKMYETSSYEERRGEITMLEKQVDDIFKEHELVKEQLAQQKAEKVRLDYGLKKILLDVFLFYT